MLLMLQSSCCKKRCLETICFCKVKKCSIPIMATLVFEWARTVISQQYLDSMSLDPDVDRNNVIKEMALTAKVKVEWNSKGQVFLEGAWEHIMKIHVMLVKYLKPPAQEDTSLCTKTNTKAVVRYIRQKYLNASRRRSAAVQSKKPSPENEVYVNITVGGDLELPSYQATNQLVSSDDLLIEHDNKTNTKEGSDTGSCRSPVVWEGGSALLQTGALLNGSRSAKKKDYEKLAPFKFFCTLCSFKSKRESHYQRHLELHSKVSELFSCQKCDFTTLRLGHLRRHEMSHSETQFACSKCHYYTDHHKWLLRHQRLKHSQSAPGRDSVVRKELLRCVECGYSTTRPYFYQRHLQAHTSSNNPLLRDEHRFHCQQCSYKTGRKEHFIRHVNNVHNNNRPYLCDHCGKAFKRPDALKQHRSTHVEPDSTVGAFRCSVCGKYCRAQAQLTQHQAVHSNVRSFLCEICGAAFKTRAVQRKHVLTIHKNPKAFSCPQCSRKFNTKYALRRHMKQHSLDKKRKSGSSEDEPVAESEGALRVLQSEPILIQEAPRADNQTAITVQVIGFMPYSDT
ncbi:zinc finger protein 275-like isoform X2 [Periplaneta americana]|uniref:zinc finger protein 275-like isoform X2 n=1 Tax=Periplaneta americana TaxID=6978 RepID=UPI0037E8C2BB